MSRGHRLYFLNKIVFLSLMIVFVLANSVDPDEMPHYAAFHLGLHCLPKHTELQTVKSLTCMNPELGLV